MNLAVTWAFMSLLKHHEDSIALLLFSVSRLKGDCSNCSTSDLAREEKKVRSAEKRHQAEYPLPEKTEDGRPCDDLSPPPINSLCDFCVSSARKLF